MMLEWQREVADVCQAHGLPVDVLKSPRRFPRYVDARQDAARVLRARGWSLTRIGRALGGRDHTTILSLLRRAQQ